MNESTLPDIDAMWDFNDVPATEKLFRRLLAELDAGVDAGGTAEYRLQLLTQIARTHSLRREFDAAHALLDSVERELKDDTPMARVRYLLERGRTFNSSGRKVDARPLFMEAWQRARAIGQDGLAVDAAHMIAIVETGETALDWNIKALEYAKRSDQPKARKWLASLYNNIGWTHHDAGRFEKALECFEQVLVEQARKGDAKLTRIARWCIARCLRSLGRVEEALMKQRELESEAGESAKSDGFVQEEIAECLHALGRIEESREYFRHAHELLSKDAWLMESQPGRIERLRQLGTEGSERR